MDAEDAIGRGAEELLPPEGHAAFRTAFDAFASDGVGRCRASRPKPRCSTRRPARAGRLAWRPAPRTAPAPPCSCATSRRGAPPKNANCSARRAWTKRAWRCRVAKARSGGQAHRRRAHDFNNILHIISANVQLCCRSGNNTEKRLRNILDAVERGSKLSSQLLAFARRQPLHPSLVDVPS